MKHLDPLSIPLSGVQLIEASAGTGKTYTITTLYLRLLLEQGLDLGRILVVTFTQAATEELRGRIRLRVAQALAGLEGREPSDPTLTALLARLPDPGAARVALVNALTHMDEAAIHTIHGFCQRMLEENAFESGAPFDMTCITDEGLLRRTAIADFWRRRLAGASLEEAAWIRAEWPDPEALLKALESTLALDDLRLLPPLDAARLQAAQAEARTLLARLRGDWRADRAALARLLETSPALNRRSYTKPVVAKALAAMDALAADDDLSTLLPSALPPSCERLSARMLAEKCKEGKAPPTHPLFDLCADLEQRLPRLAVWRRAGLFIEARDAVRHALERHKATRRMFYFDDLLRHLDQALTADAGDGTETQAEALAAAIRARFPVALIDEFQDTDPQQYRIFRRVYRDRPDCGLFLIGDPKQAIYAFRGADIFTYMGACADTSATGARHTLGVNRRSGTRLVTAVNALFSNAPAPFVYDDSIPFQPVNAAPNADACPFTLDGVEPAPLQIWTIPLTEANATRRPAGYLRREAATEEAGRACAEHIAGLLIAADAGRARLGDQPLRPQDIAVLVRTHREGERMQQALRACNVNSVGLSQDSVLDTEQAAELATLLAAIAEPGDEGRVRAALATVLMGWDAAELDALAQDEARWEGLLARFQDYRTRWLEGGFMVAFQRLLGQEGIPRRLLRRPDGERCLTNLLQLAELLQAASREHPGLEGLLRWLAVQRAGDSRDEARQLRLESDEGLVKVITMHKSKGLEYPLVFVPFPWSRWSPRQPPPPLFHDPADSFPCLDLGAEDQEAHRALARTEALAEQLRLFYVTITRAARLCVLCWGRVHQAEDSAPAYLLHPDPTRPVPASRLQDLDDAGLGADLQALADRAPGAIEVRELPAPTGARWAGPQVDYARLAAARFQGGQGVIDTRWQVSSYSGLVRGDESGRPDHDPPPILNEDPASEPVPTPVLPLDPLFAFPAGTEAGQYLHELLEHLNFPHAQGEALRERAQTLLARYGGLGGGDSDWGGVAETLVGNCLDTPLDSGGDGGGELRLRDIAWGDRVNELEFHYSMGTLTPAALRAALAPFPDYRDRAEGLGFAPCHGLMHGFIDLVFRYRGRYYLADYKSNRLGLSLADYDRAGMDQAMQAHRYNLQYLIYTVALHRFLGQRLPGYDYDRHFGGAYYLFLRGLRPSEGPRYGVWFDRPGRLVIDALEGLFRGVAAA